MTAFYAYRHRTINTRHAALGLPETPPNSVIISLALFLTFLSTLM